MYENKIDKVKQRGQERRTKTKVKGRKRLERRRGCENRALPTPSARPRALSNVSFRSAWMSYISNFHARSFSFFPSARRFPLKRSSDRYPASSHVQRKQSTYLCVSADAPLNANSSCRPLYNLQNEIVTNTVSVATVSLTMKASRHPIVPVARTLGAFRLLTTMILYTYAMYRMCAIKRL